jgi:hypothetical protein
MARKYDNRSGKLGVWGWVFLVLVFYILLSAAFAMGTANKCGELKADKTWQIFPPGWQCG